MCSKPHALHICDEFVKNRDEHLEFIQSKGLCFGCLNKGHYSKDCCRRLTCKTCGNMHPTVLHYNPKDAKTPSNQEELGEIKNRKEAETNSEQAVSNCTRLNQLKRRFDSNKKYKEDYTAFMESMIQNGYAESVPSKNPSGVSEGQEISYATDRKIWYMYIPHHEVYHMKKPNKILVVFDCSVEFKAETLNRHLLQGPDVTNNLVGVLFRFRQEPVAFMCDIESMFHQVGVAEEYRDLLRFLWWEDGDTSKDPLEFRMTVHLFDIMH